MTDATYVYQVMIDCPDGSMGNLYGTVEHGPIFSTPGKARTWVRNYRGPNYPSVVRRELDPKG